VLSAGATATIDFALQLRGVATEVVITASNSVIDPSRTEQGSSLSYNAIANLPLVSRNPFNFILQQPNVSGRANTEFGVPRKLNANGFNGRINYQLDGANNVQSDRAGIRLMPASNTWVQEVQQVSNGFAPEFGNTVGTVFNTITRSGTNDLHGEGAFIWRRTPYSARPALLKPRLAHPGGERQLLQRQHLAAPSRKTRSSTSGPTKGSSATCRARSRSPRPTSRCSACPPPLPMPFPSGRT
jgi:hypothetical protein